MWHSTGIMEFFYQNATTQGDEFLTFKWCPKMFTAFMQECK